MPARFQCLQADVTLCCQLVLSVSGGPSQWPVGDTTDPQPEQVTAPVSRQTAGKHSESSEDHNSDASLHCSF